MNEKVIKLAKCPICKKTSSKKSHPFCSIHCSRVDLGRWFKESYSVQSIENNDEDDIFNPNED